MKIKLDSIQLLKETQPRTELISRVITEYAEEYKNSESQMPSIVVFQNGDGRWLADGWHRYYGAKQAGKTFIEAEIIEGTLRDAILYSVKANATHGMRRTNEDKRRAVETLLTDAEWGKWSDNKTAKQCEVSQPFVGEIRKSLITVISDNTERVYTTKHGTEATMDTRAIGKTAEKIIASGELEASEPISKSKFNRTNQNIEWAAWTWNPVTGCENGCGYCYARDIAERFNADGFKPTFHEDRLSAPSNTNPDMTIPGGNAVFVCSMADLFGKWVPNDWIFKVMAEVEKNPQWTFIFLTKNPRRYKSIQFPKNAWIGATVDTQKRVEPTEAAMLDADAEVKFVSCEPMLEAIQFTNLKIIHWVIIGARSRTSTGPEMQPEFKWVLDLTVAAEKAKCAVYWKPNLTVRPKGYPR